jgi:hypothetical protein
MTIYIVRIPHQRPVQAFTAENKQDARRFLWSLTCGCRDFETLEEAAAHDMHAAFIGNSVEDVLGQMSWLTHKRFEAEAAVRSLA